MSGQKWSLSFFILFCFMLLTPLIAFASTVGTENLSKAEKLVDQAILEVKNGDLTKAEQTFKQFRDTWLQIEHTVKTDSGTVYKEIESNMGQVDFAFMQKKPEAVLKGLNGLKAVNEKYIAGNFSNDSQFKQENITLNDFILLLQKAKDQAQNHQQQLALETTSKIRESWLSVEGVVVSQSATVYNDSERDMVVVDAMLAANPPDYTQASQVLDRMINYLSPLAAKTGYTIWDAALILIREGLEALLVVAALLAFINKSANGKGKGWVWAGVLVGLAVSTLLAVIVNQMFSSGAFGSNNSLIAGWTGIIAAVMLLYVSYWLHSQSSIADWQKYLRSKSQSAISTGRLITLGVLSFLAIFREGTETVLFLIGMGNQISLSDLLLGLLIGLGILAVISYIMLFVGLKLPIRPFFMVSSVIVFYLCLKFTGMGIHSLQLAGTLPSTPINVPSIDLIALYPSWQSTLPQVLLVAAAIFVVIWRKAGVKTQGTN